MPYLNWKNSPVELETLPHPKRDVQLLLKLSETDMKTLTTSLEEVFSDPQAELRLELPKNWTVFWKSREGESRLLLAHPEHDTWVSTVSLDLPHGRLFLDALKELRTPGDRISPAESGAIGRVSNLDLILTLV